MNDYSITKDENKIFNDQFNHIKNSNKLNINKKTSKPRFIIPSNFTDLTNLYHKKGFKIPKLSPETNNFFKIDPLLDGQIHRICNGLHQKNKVINKGVSYLMKLRETIEHNLSSNRNQVFEQSANYKKGYFNHEEKLEQKQERKTLLKDTKILLDLIELYGEIPLDNVSNQASIMNNHFIRTQSLRKEKREDELGSIDKQCSLYKHDFRSVRNSRNNISLRIEKNPFKACSSTLSLMTHKKTLSNQKIKENQRSLSDTSCSITPAVISSHIEEEDEKKYLAMAYQKALTKRYGDLNHILKFYLKKYKKCKDEDINKYLKAKSSKSEVIYDRINEFQLKIQSQKLPDKIIKMYLEAKKLNHITQTRIKLFSTEDAISKLNNQFLMGINPIT